MSRAIITLIIITFSIFASAPQLTAKTKVSKGNSEIYAQFKGVNIDSLIIALCKEHGTSRVGGIWSATTDGATIGIITANVWTQKTGITNPDMKRNMAEQWIIILIDSPSPTLQPGTIIGWFSPSAKPDYFNAQIYTNEDDAKLSKPKQFILHLADDGHLTMKAIRKGIEINPWRFLPYMIRGSVKYRDDSPRDLDGFIKKWPTPHNPQNPRYL